MPKLPLEYLRHISEETSFILTQTNNILEENFYNDPILKRAVIRSLEIIGEASKNISKDFKDRIDYKISPIAMKLRYFKYFYTLITKRCHYRFNV